MSDIRDLLRKAVGRPGHQPDVSAITVAAHLRAQRQRLAVRGGAIAAIVVVAAGSIAAFGGGDGRRVEIAAASTVSSADASVSVELPEGWQQLDVVNRVDPTEILVVGTAPRPAGDPIQACTFNEGMPTTRSAFVTIYEYGDGDAPNPFGEGFYPPDAFQPRSDDVTTWADRGHGGDCPNVPLQQIYNEFAATTSTSPLPAPDETAPTTSTSIVLPEIPAELIVNHFREIPFTEQDRRFLARVVSVEDPDSELLEEGLAILNSLAVTAPDAPTTTTTVAPGFDEEAAKQQIIDAIVAANGGASSVSLNDSVEGGHPFADPDDAEDAAAKAEAQNDPSYTAAKEDRISARINWVTFESPTYARVNFDVLADGQQITVTTTGYAVFEGANWRIGRATFCEIVARGGYLECPS